jgi:hypothetical protein
MKIGKLRIWNYAPASSSYAIVLVVECTDTLTLQVAYIVHAAFSDNFIPYFSSNPKWA